MFGDKSPRTKRIAKNAISVIVATSLITIGSIGYVAGSFKFNNVVARSSTPIGSEMTFYRSNSRVTIKDIYTDKNKSVLIARLGDEDGSRLPFKGSDFNIYISSKSTDSLKKLPILFGRMSTDGDLFLVIPNPTDTVYSVFIMNTNYLGVSSTNDLTQSNIDLNTGSITSALSNYQYSDKPSKQGTYKIDNDSMDVVSFRLTMKPAFDTEQYRPKVIDADLLTKNDDGSQSFEFETFFDKVFKESAIKTTRQLYDQLGTKKSQVEKVLKEYSDRLTTNPNDTVAKNAYSQAKSQIEEIDRQQKEYAKTIADYNLLTYDSSYFDDLQTSAIVVKTQK